MSFYVYSTEEGVAVERRFPLGKAPKHVYIDGKIATRDFRMELCPNREPWGATPGGYPKTSCAMGVHPKQVPDMERKCAAAGVPTTFDKRTGDPTITSLSHQRKLMKALGMYDRAAWY